MKVNNKENSKWADISMKSLSTLNTLTLLVHQGKAFIYQREDVLNNNDTLFIVIGLLNQNKGICIIPFIRSLLSCNVYFTENCSFTGGSPITGINRNRINPLEHEAILIFNPTITGVGDILFSTNIEDEKELGGISRISYDWLLAPNKAYLLAIQSKADSNKIFTRLNWYEEMIEFL